MQVTDYGIQNGVKIALLLYAKHYDMQSLILVILLITVNDYFFYIIIIVQ